MRKIILASNSPRRKELLKQIVDEFEIIGAVKPEVIPKFSLKKNVSKYLAKQKSLEVYENNQDCLVIGADTTVICNNQILGKPKDKDDVYRMISMLSNKTHIVVTGVYVVCKEYHKSFSCITKVTFKKMSEEQIIEYCKLENVYDKAGAYAIQEEAGQYIEKIEGDYNNVVGLPVEMLKKYLR